MSKNFERKLEINAASEKIYDALTNEIQLWWTDRLAQENDQLTVYFGDSYKCFKVANFPSGNGDFQIRWYCSDANLKHPNVSDSEEWISTNIIWDVVSQESVSVITLTHEGLNSSLQCYDICVSGWELFFLGSLKSYLETGEGKPFSSPEN